MTNDTLTSLSNPTKKLYITPSSYHKKWTYKSLISLIITFQTPTITLLSNCRFSPHYQVIMPQYYIVKAWIVSSWHHTSPRCTFAKSKIINKLYDSSQLKFKKGFIFKFFSKLLLSIYELLLINHHKQNNWQII